MLGLGDGTRFGEHPSGFGDIPWVWRTPCVQGTPLVRVTSLHLGDIPGFGDPPRVGGPLTVPPRSCRVLGRATLRLSQISRDPDKLEGERGHPFLGSPLARPLPHPKPHPEPPFLCPQRGPPGSCPPLGPASCPSTAPGRTLPGYGADLGEMGYLGREWGICGENEELLGQRKGFLRVMGCLG